MSIYDDVMAAQQLIDECYDLTTGEIDEAQEQEAKELKNCVLKLGLETLCKVRANKISDIEYLKLEEKRIAEKRKKLESQNNSLEDYIYTIYQQGDSPIQQAGTFTLSTRKSTQVIVDDDFNDERFQTIVEEKKVDKIALKKALSIGEVINGARLQTNYNLQVK